MVDDPIVIPSRPADPNRGAPERREVRLSEIKTRTARCSCGREAPSVEGLRFDGKPAKLAFFEFHGPDFRDSCDVCGYFQCNHLLDMPDGINPATRRIATITDHHWINSAGLSHDMFYCGCRGWD